MTLAATLILLAGTVAACSGQAPGVKTFNDGATVYTVDQRVGRILNIENSQKFLQTLENLIGLELQAPNEGGNASIHKRAGTNPVKFLVADQSQAVSLIGEEQTREWQPQSGDVFARTLTCSVDKHQECVGQPTLSYVFTTTEPATTIFGTDRNEDFAATEFCNGKLYTETRSGLDVRASDDICNLAGIVYSKLNQDMTCDQIVTEFSEGITMAVDGTTSVFQPEAAQSNVAAICNAFGQAQGLFFESTTTP